MPDPNTEHGLRVQLATALRERDEARAAMEAMKNRDYAPLKKWIEENAPDAVQRAYRIMVKAETERDSLRTTLTEVNDLLTSVPDGADWRQVVRRKVVVALFGEAAWTET